MTAIVALIEDDVVYMGGDGAGVAGLSLVMRKDPKVFKNGSFVIGFTTSFRMGQLLRYKFKPPKHPDNISDNVYMNTLFIDKVRRCFEDNAYKEGGNFIVGYKGKLFIIDNDFQVGIPVVPYASVGCGHDLCKGSLHSTQKLDIDPKKRIKMALEAAEVFSGGVSKPFTILSLKE